MEKIINNNPLGYAEKRNITFDPRFLFIRKKDFFSLCLSLFHFLTGKGYNAFFKGFYFNPFDQKTKCHFFNSINLGRNEWKVTYETTLPRIGSRAPRFMEKLAIKALEKNNCTEIIALSKCAYNLQIDYLENYYPSSLKYILPKLKIKYPPQREMIGDFSEKNVDVKSIVFTIVGADFFRKGGGEILKVFEELIPLYPFLKLNVVSRMNYGDYATKTTENDYKEAMRIIESFKSNISHYWSLPNNEVISLFKNSHIGLLPTWADSFGYTVLEAQSQGCPVITTNLRALPEINNNEIGWLLEIPLLDSKNAKIKTKRDRDEFKLILIKNFKEVILNIISDRDSINQKGLNALSKIKYDYEASLPQR